MNWDTFAWVGFGGLSLYVFGQLILFKQIDAVSYWEARGYINGLVRGSGSYENAIANLDQWKDYWLAQKSWMSFVINNLYNHGVKLVGEIY